MTKKCISVLLTVLMIVNLLSVIPAVSAKAADNRILFGDLNGDDAVDVVDITLITRYLNGYIQLSDTQKVLADVNGDEIIDRSDLDFIVNNITFGVDFSVYDQLIDYGSCGNNVYYMLKDDGVLVVFGKGEMNDVYPAPWAEYAKRVEKVVFRFGVTNIPDFLFSTLYSNLKTVTVADTVESIGKEAFYNCASLNSATVPNSVTSIGVGAFDNCPQLTLFGTKSSCIRTYARKNNLAFFPISMTIDMDNCTVRLAREPFYIYSGDPCEPEIVVLYKSTPLFKNIDYSVEYEDNVNAGTAKVIVTGTETNREDLICTGRASIGFPISPIWITNCSVKLSKTSYYSDGKEKKPDVIVQDGSYTLIPDIDYTVEYKDNINPGTASVVITGKGNYADTITENFKIINSEGKFIWDRDNWNFSNTWSCFSLLPRESCIYHFMIEPEYEQMLKDNLNPAEYEFIFGKDGFIYKKCGGFCYGMAALTALSEQGYVPYERIQPGAECLHDLDEPINNKHVMSLIIYYLMLQYKDNILQTYIRVSKNTHEQNIKDILSLLDRNSAVVLSISNFFYGHTIVATDYEYGEWTINGNTYQGCIHVCDPNSADFYDEDCNVYFDTDSYDWIIPSYQNDCGNSRTGSRFEYIGADAAELNNGGVLTGPGEPQKIPYAARLNAYDIAEKRHIVKVKKEHNKYTEKIMSSDSGDIVESYFYSFGDSSDRIAGYNLFDADSSYKVTQSSCQKLDLSLRYEDCYLTAGSSAGESVIFDKDGFVRITGDPSDYHLSITSNKDYPTDWFTIEVAGAGADTASLKKTDEGYILEASDLHNVRVNANNKEVSAETAFSTEYDSVLIYEKDVTTIGIKADTDGDGVYETEVSAVAAEIVGDADGDGSVTIFDATAIQRHLASLSVKSYHEKAADADSDGFVTIFDATAIQRYLASIPTSAKDIGKPITV